MKQLLIAMVMFLFVLPSNSQSIKPSELVKNAKTEQALKQVNFLTPTGRNSQEVPSEISNYQLFDIDKTAIARILDSESKAIAFNMSKNERESFSLELVEVDLPLFLVKSAPSMENVKYQGGKHYRGIVRGDNESVAAISIFDGQVMGLISESNSKGNWVFGKLEDSESYILYSDPEIMEKFNLGCETEDSFEPYEKHEVYEGNGIRALSDCVGMYFEVDYDIYQSKGSSVTSTTDYVTGLYNQVALLYAAENINTTISEIVVWSQQSPYTGTTSSAMLNQFASNTGAFNGDIGMLLSYKASGGIAYVNGLCSSSSTYRKSFSSIDASYQNVPTYSWSVMVVTHEFGHLLGSQHTHACVWNGNSTAIDGCYTTEGGCPNPGNPSAGGTIMSYCHLTSVGINLNNGFGTQPGNVIRSRITSASCLDACDSNPPPPPPECAQNEATLSITFDNYPAETTWTIKNTSGTTLYSGGPYSTANATINIAICEPDGCYNFNVNDSYGDGICCSYGQGSYAVSFNGSNLITGGQFGASETKQFCLSGGGVTPTCTDGIQNGDETGVDCGGSCAPCATCNDGIQNGDETGVDCGGSCPTACATCTDGIQNGDETGVDCGGSCAPCATCNDGIQNGDETGVDCGGSCPTACATCTDGIQNGDETGVDCGGSCAPCATCNDGIQNGDETGVDCGGSCPTACATCSDGIQNGNETGVDCGGSCAPCTTCNDGIQNGDETGVDCGGSCPTACATCTDGIQNGNETGVDCGGSCAPCNSGCTTVTVSIIFDNYPGETTWNLKNASGTVIKSGGPYNTPGGSITVTECLTAGCYDFTINDSYGDGICCSYGSGSFSVSNGSTTYVSGSQFGSSSVTNFCVGSAPAPTCTDGIQNGDETGVDCGGSCPTACATCTDGIQNGNETGVDCGGSCAPCTTCNDGIQNGDETGVDCGGSCPTACATCTDGIQNGNETGVDCGGSCAPCITCNDGIQNGDETGVDCGGSCPTACATCTDGIQNGNETGVDCGGSCAPCNSGCTTVTVSIIFDNYPGETTWNLKNASGTVIKSGGPYNTPGGSITVTECLTAGCYDFTINDSYGDGICCSYGSGSFSVSNGSTTYVSGSQFGSSSVTNFCVGSAPAPTCTDGIQNGNETGVDCGGSCAPCTTCNDGIQNGDETGVDCGGSCPTACATCTDGIQNGNETGVDCGGSCAPCASCNDGIQNGNETGVDCGGSCAPCDEGGSSELFAHYFETGWDGWADGGSDCYRNNGASFAYEGNYSIRLRDGSGFASSMTSPNYNLTPYNTVQLQFHFYPVSMETGEKLLVKYFNGSAWSTVASYTSGTDFNNDVFYSSTVTLNSGTVNFSNTSQFRFECQGSTNSDYIYIDAVVLTGNSGAGLIEFVNNIEVIREGYSILNDNVVRLRPNPTTDYINVDIYDEEERIGEIQAIDVYDMMGRNVLSIRNIDGENIRVDVSSLTSGAFIMRINTEGEEVLTQKFQVVRH